MEKIRVTSRAIINDPIYKKVSQTRFMNHKQALKKPYSTSFHSVAKQNQTDPNQIYAMQILKYKKAKITCEQNINPIAIQNKALYRRMHQIDKRRALSLINQIKVIHTSPQKSLNKKIKQENKVFFTRIKQVRQQLITKQQLKRQFQQVQKLKMHSRKIKETIKKTKKTKKLSQFIFKKHPREFILAQSQPPKYDFTLTPLIIR